MKRKSIFSIIIFGVAISSTVCAVLIKNSEFLGAVIDNPNQMGAILPCTSEVGQEMVKYLSSYNGKKILEVGGGTGTVTEQIVSKLSSNDKLDVVEIDASLSQHLRKKFKKHKNVTIHQCSITDFNPGVKYSQIISTLPFNSFDVTFAKNVMNKFEELSGEGGRLSYVEYVGSACKQYIPFIEGRENVKEVKKFLTSYRTNHTGEKVIKWFNFPPIYVYHLGM